MKNALLVTIRQKTHINRLMVIRLAGPDQREMHFLSVGRAFGLMKTRLQEIISFELFKRKFITTNT